MLLQQLLLLLLKQVRREAPRWWISGDKGKGHALGRRQPQGGQAIVFWAGGKHHHREVHLNVRGAWTEGGLCGESVRA